MTKALLLSINASPQRKTFIVGEENLSCNFFHTGKGEGEKLIARLLKQIYIYSTIVKHKRGLPL